LKTRIHPPIAVAAAWLLIAASGQKFGVTLSAAQKQTFVASVLATDQLHIEEELPRRLAPLHVFKPYFSMYQLASTAYALVLESPRDMSRWRALAKIDAYADGEYTFGYDSARRKALARNPCLFDACARFQRWADKARRGENI
jgi:hypothetical protein